MCIRDRYFLAKYLNYDPNIKKHLCKITKDLGIAEKDNPIFNQLQYRMVIHQYTPYLNLSPEQVKDLLDEKVLFKGQYHYKKIKSQFKQKIPLLYENHQNRSIQMEWIYFLVNHPNPQIKVIDNSDNQHYYGQIVMPHNREKSFKNKKFYGIVLNNAQKIFHVKKLFAADKPSQQPILQNNIIQQQNAFFFTPLDKSYQSFVVIDQNLLQVPFSSEIQDFFYEAKFYGWPIISQYPLVQITKIELSDEENNEETEKASKQFAQFSAETLKDIIILSNHLGNLDFPPKVQEYVKKNFITQKKDSDKQQKQEEEKAMSQQIDQQKIEQSNILGEVKVPSKGCENNQQESVLPKNQQDKKSFQQLKKKLLKSLNTVWIFKTQLSFLLIVKTLVPLMMLCPFVFARMIPMKQEYILQILSILQKKILYQIRRPETE
eukprot:TRINITY_DN1498_c0_g1_i1.p1 TRINITY_DN1498_c0_g1~~TRINITY_DN1498_c0_g1_i1.p1  ORF type:complete len:432 (-),score=69.44 TRINITY_DN1498_c0_g1_i1:955-2250(-)